LGGAAAVILHGILITFQRESRAPSASSYPQRYFGCGAMSAILLPLQASNCQPRALSLAFVSDGSGPSYVWYRAGNRDGMIPWRLIYAAPRIPERLGKGQLFYATSTCQNGPDVFVCVGIRRLLLSGRTAIRDSAHPVRVRLGRRKSHNRTFLAEKSL